MVAFPVWALGLLLVIAAVGVLATLHSIASSVRNDRYVHDLLAEAADLRASYVRRLRKLADDAGVDLDDLSDVEMLD